MISYDFDGVELSAPLDLPILTGGFGANSDQGTVSDCYTIESSTDTVWISMSYRVDTYV